MNHPRVHDCMGWVRFYNYERIHQSQGYETPAHVHLGVKSIKESIVIANNNTFINELLLLITINGKSRQFKQMVD